MRHLAFVPPRPLILSLSLSLFPSHLLLYLPDSGRVDIRKQLLGALDEQGVEGAGVVSVFCLRRKRGQREVENRNKRKQLQRQQNSHVRFPCRPSPLEPPQRDKLFERGHSSVTGDLQAGEGLGWRHGASARAQRTIKKKKNGVVVEE